MNSVIENLEMQAHIGHKMNNANGTLLKRIANMCSWMEPSDLDIRIEPIVGEGAKRRHMLMGEMLGRI